MILLQDLDEDHGHIIVLNRAGGEVEHLVDDLFSKLLHLEIRIVLEGLQGEESIATLCRREGINPNL